MHPRFLFVLTAALALWASVAVAQPTVPVTPAENPSTFLGGIGGTESALTGGEVKKDDVLEQALKEASKGDDKPFNITVDEETNLTKVKQDDVYTGGDKTYFRIVAVQANGEKGGTLAMVRTHGKSDPPERLTRVKGEGPDKIVRKVHLIDYYWAAGWPAHLIAVLAIAAILMAANSVWLYRRGRQCPAGLVGEARARLDRGDVAGVDALAQRSVGLFAAILRALTDRFETSTTDDIRSRVEITASAYLASLRVPAKALNFIAVCAPLIGLAGTIYGMIIVFEGVAGAAGPSQAAILAAGIRLKLLCTLFALMVAVPALTLFFVFNSRLGTITAECEMLAEEFMHKIIVLKRENGKATPLPGALSTDGAKAEPALSR